MKPKTKPRAPIIKELHYSKEEIAEVKRIQTEEVHTRKKDLIRELLKGPLCCVCHNTVPTKRVEYALGGVRRIETYCDEHFPIYERTRDVDINEIMKGFGCRKAPERTFGGSKDNVEKKGYSLTPKSSMSSDSTARCNRCGFRIMFSDSQRGPQGGLIPLDMAGQIHNCGITMSFPCRICNEQIYLDSKVLSPTGRRIPLSAIDSRPHDCPKKEEA